MCPLLTSNWAGNLWDYIHFKWAILIPKIYIFKILLRWNISKKIEGHIKKNLKKTLRKMLELNFHMQKQKSVILSRIICDFLTPIIIISWMVLWKVIPVVPAVVCKMNEEFYIYDAWRREPYSPLYLLCWISMKVPRSTVWN